MSVGQGPPTISSSLAFHKTLLARLAPALLFLRSIKVRMEHVA